jgi:DNA-directed RNA polymerase subunit RPC12/RpoP
MGLFDVFREYEKPRHEKQYYCVNCGRNVTREHHYGTTLQVKGKYLNWCDSCYQKLFPEAESTRGGRMPDHEEYSAR